jgi:DnaJ-class molecular chaperone
MTTTTVDRLKELGVTTAPARCNYCGGDGKDFASTCPVCNGQGSVLVVQPAVKCATCGGDGKDFTSRCKACGGSGWAHTVEL